MGEGDIALDRVSDSVAEIYSPGPHVAKGRTSLGARGSGCHQSVLVQVSGLVICSLEDGRASHSSLGSCDNDEVFSGDAE